MISEKIKEDVIDYLRGSCKGTHDAAEIFEIEEDEVLAIVVETNEIELCTQCGWWCENHEFVEDSYHDLVCSDCYEENN